VTTFNTYIEVSFQWSGTHCYPTATGVHSYLSNQHRHLFKGTATIEVFHDDRELEYFAVLDFINKALLVNYKNLAGRSCERVAYDILNNLQIQYDPECKRYMEVKITEDGENGSIVRRMP
jgi:hypothetical protein